MSNNHIESHSIKINGRTAHYLKAGRGPAVVLIHGGASDARDWTGTMETLGDRFSFYALDLLGYGESERNETGYYLNDFTEFLTGFIDILNLKKPALVGHSLGAKFCLDMAFKDQDKIKKLVLVDATGLGGMTVFGNALQLLFWGFRKIFRIPQPHPNFLLKPGEKFDRNVDDELRQLKIPTMLIWKNIDPYYSVAIARRAAKIIPNVKLAVLEGYGHAPHRKNTKKFSRILAEFLDGK
jgi:pimeloyl-ACP methyl ester carboxylesterase